MVDATLTHVRLLVDEYAACVRFYRDAFDFELTFGDEASGYADFDTGTVTLALFDAAEMAGAVEADPSAPRGRDDVAVVIEVPDVDAAWDALADEECDRVAGPKDHPEWGIRTAHVRDPDGTLVEVNESIPME